MTLLGHHSPHLRLANAVRGLVRRPVPRGPRDDVLVVGHRGAPKEAPENTVESFSKALALGAELGEVLAARDAGRIESVIVWTQNHEGRLRELVALGVDAILTDEPDLLRAIVGSRGARLEEARK